jgi:2-C-methyl-D-erythritol 2,4-cyclodiphosphate synthase
MSNPFPLPLSIGLRTGLGYDTHRLEEGRPLTLAGLVLPSPRGPIAHSDGDVLCHAIVDALLGAAALGDIGRHFPDKDPKWKNTPGLTFLQHTRRLLEDNGYRIVNIDATVVLDEPKLAPHMEKITQRIAEALGIDSGQVSVKAKTSEGVTPNLAMAQAITLIERRAVR